MMTEIFNEPDRPFCFFGVEKIFPRLDPFRQDPENRVNKESGGANPFDLFAVLDPDDRVVILEYIIVFHSGVFDRLLRLFSFHPLIVPA